MKEQQRIHIGTSGWHYQHWQGPFYPPALAPPNFLDYYAQYFQTAEINNTFYQLPSEATLAGWADKVPEGFIFAVKASRYITHMKKLKDAARTLAPLLERVNILGNKLGPILFQLPPRWHCNLERLHDFLAVLPSDRRYAIEFRDPSWLTEKTYEALAAHQVAFCIYDFAGRQTPKAVTADLIYLRLHGPAGPYQGCYDTPFLAGWAGAFAAWAAQGKEIFCYFDNDEAGYAVQNAWRLQQMITNG
ncbi:MAG: DUF72 domain-containing protein [Deltaproteobacteria bacterium]|nr:MAG: DUF72 domain-containing protein [Deltaproteobacteria bacterium]